METPPASSPLPKLIAMSGQKNSHMTLHPSLQGRRRASVGKKKEIEKPRPSPAGPRKSLYAVFSAHETSLVHPRKVDSQREVIMAVQLKLLITISQMTHGFHKPAEVSKPAGPVPELRSFVNSIRRRWWLVAGGAIT